MKPKRKRPKRNGSRKKPDHDDMEQEILEILKPSKEAPEDQRIEKDLNRLTKDVVGSGRTSRTQPLVR